MLVDVCVSHKTHLRSVQVGNACVKEGNTHVNGEGLQQWAFVRSEPCKLRNSQSISNFTFLTNITVSRGNVTKILFFRPLCIIMFISNYTNCICVFVNEL